MARPIKVTPEQIDEVIADFKSKLTASKMKQGKFEYTKVFTYVDRKAVVYVSELAWLKMRALVDNYNTEVGWFGFAGRLGKEEDDYYGITDIIIPPQQVSGAKVDTDPVEFEKWLDSLTDDQFNDLHFQAHSHVNMDCGPSGTDTQTEIDMISRIKTDSFYIFAILNKSRKHTIRIYDLKKNIFFDTADVEIKVVESNIGVMKMLRESEKVVTEKKYTPTYGSGYYGNYGGYNGYNYGGYQGGSYTPKKENKPEPKKDKKSKKDKKAKKKAFKEDPGVYVKIVMKDELGNSDLYDAFTAKDDDTIVELLEEYGVDASVDVRAKLDSVEVDVKYFAVEMQYLPAVCGLGQNVDHTLVLICDYDVTKMVDIPTGLYNIDDNETDDPYGPFGYM